MSLPLPSSFLPSALLLLLFSFHLEVSTGMLKLFKFNCRLYFRHHRSLLSSTNFKFNLQLYYLTTQAVIVFYQFQVQLQLYFRTTQAQLCSTNSRATVYYLEFILFSHFSNYLATKHLISTLSLPNFTIIKSRTSSFKSKTSFTKSKTSSSKSNPSFA